MNRRQAIQRAALMMGGALSLPLVSGVLAGCTSREPVANFTPQALSDDQHQLLRIVVDRIIPATDTPGAADAGVDQFIDRMLAAWYPQKERSMVDRGLAQIDERAQAEYRARFVELTQGQQVALLEVLDAEMIEQQEDEEGMAHPFYLIKELTLVGYYTSEIGMTEELQYEFIPGRFEACVPVDEVRREQASA